jgi:hypothetical protein
MILFEKTPSLILKFYVMQGKGKGISGGDIREAVGYLQNGYNMENDLTGMGFSVLSDGILNICRWHNEYSDVIVPSVFTFDKEDFRWLRENIEKVGAFCSGEKAVYDHENSAWLRYVRSGKEAQDKVNYLTDTLKSGTIVGE